MIDLSQLIPESCDHCGLCCVGIGSPVMLYQSRLGAGDSHPFRPSDLPAELGREIDEEFGGLQRGEEPLDACLWFDAETRRCKHYEWRPQVCRDYTIAEDACLIRRDQYRKTGK